MITKLILAVVVAALVGLALVALVGPILVGFGIPIATIVGNFFVRWGWFLGVAAGIWYYFGGSNFKFPTWGSPKPPTTPPAA